MKSTLDDIFGDPFGDPLSAPVVTAQEATNRICLLCLLTCAAARDVARVLGEYQQLLLEHRR